MLPFIFIELSRIVLNFYRWIKTKRKLLGRGKLLRKFSFFLNSPAISWREKFLFPQIFHLSWLRFMQGRQKKKRSPQKIGDNESLFVTSTLKVVVRSISLMYQWQPRTPVRLLSLDVISQNTQEKLPTNIWK